MTHNVLSDLVSHFKEIFDELGFVLESEITDHPDFPFLSNIQIARLYEMLGNQNIIIKRDDEDVVDADDEDVYDRSQANYDEIFREVVRIAPQLAGYITILQSIRPPQENEERTLIPQLQNGNSYARDRLTLMFLKVVVRNALFFHKRYNVDLQDAIQDGTEGLITALDKYFDSSYDRFSTYFPFWVRQKIERNSMFPFEDLFELPVHQRTRVMQAFEELENSARPKKHLFDIDPITEEDLIRTKIFSKKQLDYIFRVFFQPLPLESQHKIIQKAGQKMNDDEFINQVLAKLIRSTLSNLLDTLPAREAVVLRKRHGFDGDAPNTLEEVGMALGVTRERVRQIEAQALRRLRCPSIGKDLREFLGE